MSAFVVGFIGGFLTNLLFEQFVVSLPVLGVWYANRQAQRSPRGLRDRLEIEFAHHIRSHLKRGPLTLVLEILRLRRAVSEIRLDNADVDPRMRYYDDHHPSMLACVMLISATVGTTYFMFRIHPEQSWFLWLLGVVSAVEALLIYILPSSYAPAIVAADTVVIASEIHPLAGFVWILRIVAATAPFYRVMLLHYTAVSIRDELFMRLVNERAGKVHVPPKIEEPSLTRFLLRRRTGVTMQPYQYEVVAVLKGTQRSLTGAEIAHRVKMSSVLAYPVLLRLEREGQLVSRMEEVRPSAAAIGDLDGESPKFVYLYALSEGR